MPGGRAPNIEQHPFRDRVHRSFRKVTRLLQRSVKQRMKGESLRQWMERNLQNSQLGVVFELIESFISLLMVSSVVHQNWDRANYIRDGGYRYIDAINLIVVSFMYSMRFYAASNRRHYCFHWLSIIDIVCVVPLFIESIGSEAIQNSNNKYLFRFLLMVRTIRLLQLYRLLRLAKTAKLRQGVLIGLTAGCIIICAAATFQTIEICDREIKGTIAGKNCQDLTFFDAIYFVCITVGTVGYGEFAPKTRTGKVVDIFLIVFTGILIPVQISGYTDILSRERAFDKKYLPDKNNKHILLCGDIDSGSLRFFLDNWLHAEGDRSRNKRKVVILSPDLPSSSLRRILLHQDYEQRVVYLQGSAMVASDLQRAAAPSAIACFVMVKKHSETLDRNDTATNLLTCSVRKNNSHAPLYVQVSNYDNVRHVNLSGASAVVCLEQFKLSFLAKSMWIKGFIPLLGNLIQRFTIEEETSSFWLGNYVSGSAQKIIEANVPAFLFALPTFKSLALLVYREFGVVTIGVRTHNDNVVLFPAEKQLGNPNAFRSIFFIGKNKEIALKIEKLSAGVLYHHRDIAPGVELASRRSRKSVLEIILSSCQAALEGRLEFNPFRTTVTLNEDSKSTLGRNNASFGRLSMHNHDKILPVEQQPSDDLEDLNILPATSKSISGATTAAELAFAAAAAVAAAVEAQEKDDDSDGEPDLKAEAAAQAIMAERALHATVGVQSKNNENGKGELISSSSSSNEIGVYTLSRTPSQLKHHPCMVRMQTTNRNFDSENGIPTLGATTASGSRTASSRTTSSRSPSRLSQYQALVRNVAPNTLTGHYVVCGLPSSYTDFFASLHDTEDRLPPVIFVTQKELTERDFKAYLLHQDIYFIRGSSVSMKVLHEARMVYAKAIMIMSYCGSENQEENSTESEIMDEYMADVDAITTHRLISEACQNYASSTSLMTSAAATMGSSDCYSSVPSLSPIKEVTPIISRNGSVAGMVDPRSVHSTTSSGGSASSTSSKPRGRPHREGPNIIVEMIRPSNCKFLIDRSGIPYNETDAENERRKKEIMKDTKTIDEGFFSTLYAGGHVYFSNICDALMGYCVKNPFVLEILRQLVTSRNLASTLPDAEKKSRRLTQIPVPTKYHGFSYSAMVEGLLMSEGTIPLGLYCAPVDDESPPFVLTNPSPTTILSPDDLVFLIQ